MTTGQPSARRCVVLAGLAVAACAGPVAGPSVTPSTAPTLGEPSLTPTIAVTAAASPEPAPPTAAEFVAAPAWEQFGDPIEVDSSITTATATSNGIRVTIRLPSSSFSSTDGLWVTTRLENIGSKTLRWATDGCMTHVGIRAATAWAWTYGAEQPAPFGTYKDWALERHPDWQPLPIHLAVTPEQYVGRGSFGCADMGFGHELAPGAQITERKLVDAKVNRDGTLGIAPAGPVLLTATFDDWYRADEDPDVVQHDPLVTSLAVTMTGGRDPRLISAGQAIDVALQSPAVQALLIANPRVQQFAPTSVSYDDAEEQWLLSLSFFDRVAGQHDVVVSVDAREATMVAVTDQR
jgi:hypothetical protein